MGPALWIQAIGLGLSLASVALLWMSQPFQPASVAREGVAVLSRNVPAIVEKASAGLTGRAATTIVTVSLSLQLLALAWPADSAPPPSSPVVLGVVTVVALVAFGAWMIAGELILSQRLVRVAEHPPTDEVTPLAFLFELDLERRGHSSVEPFDFPADLRKALSRRYALARGFAELKG